MKYSWDHITFIRLAIPFIVGIYILKNSVWPWYIFVLIILLIIPLLSIWLRKRPVTAYRWDWVFGLLITLLFFFLGGWRIQQYPHLYHIHYFNKGAKEEEKILSVRFSEDGEAKKNYFRAQAQIDFIYEEGKWIPACGNILVYIQKSLSIKIPDYGDHYELRGKIVSPPKALNPHQFDYANYLSDNNVFDIVYIKEDADIQFIKTGGNPFFRFSYFLRRHCIATLHKFIAPEFFPLAAALIVGVKDYLDPEHYEVFSHTGTMHILAVSGLHVGLIYMSLAWLLSFFFTTAKSKKWQSIITIAAIWIFGAITGFEAAILRAVVMFSFLEIGKMQKKMTDSFNILSVAAFFLALINPLSVFSLSFILSFGAIIGILYFYPIVYEWIKVNNIFAQKIWELCSMSLAAQITTLPIIIYYFHQFPFLFLLTNLIAIPISNIIVIGGLLLCCFSFVPGLSDFLGINLNGLLHFFYYPLYWIEKIPWVNMQGLHFHKSLVGLYLILLIVWAAMRESNVKLRIRKAVLLPGALILLTGLVVYNYYIRHLNTITIYADRGMSLLEITRGNQAYYYPDSLHRDSILQKMAFSISGNHLYHNIQNLSPIHLPAAISESIEGRDSTIVIGGQSIILNASFSPEILEDKENFPKILWIHRRSFWRENELQQLYPSGIIIDATCGEKKTNVIKEMAASLCIPVKTMREQGAWHLECNQ